jgi:hypothetical protein
MHGVHPPPVVALPLENPPFEPYEYFASNETSFLAHSVALSPHPHLLYHLLNSFSNVMGIPLVVVDLHLHKKKFLILDTIQKYLRFYFTFIKIDKKKVKYIKTISYQYIQRQILVEMACHVPLSSNPSIGIVIDGYDLSVPPVKELIILWSCHPTTS